MISVRLLWREARRAHRCADGIKVSEGQGMCGTHASEEAEYSGHFHLCGAFFACPFSFTCVFVFLPVVASVSIAVL